MRYIVDSDQVNNFKFCPYCGSKSISIYDGDYNGQTECLECDKELEFVILEEIRDRYPRQFEKLMKK